jgi:hypothetical protein
LKSKNAKAKKAKAIKPKPKAKAIKPKPKSKKKVAIKVERVLSINDVLACTYYDSALAHHTIANKQGLETIKTLLTMQKSARGKLRKYFKSYASKHDDHKRRHNHVSLDVDRSKGESLDVYYIDNYLTKILRYSMFVSMTHDEIVSYFIDASDEHKAKLSKGLIEIKS